MNASQNTYSIEQQLDSIQMSESVRAEVLRAACIAQLIVDAIVWVGGKFERLSTGVFAKPSPKY
jgi:hypothetical protein